jgi:hypothetical protein
MSVAVACARLRMPLMWLGVALLVAGGALPAAALSVAGGLVLLPAVACYFRVGILRRPSVTVAAPVRGRWRAVNSPGDGVPSHGIIAYGQSHAVDLVHEPAGTERPSFGWWPLMRRPADFPGFGQPVYAPLDGVVLRAAGRQRDHLSRNSWPALVYLLAEGVRELFGPRLILGNHVILDRGDGVYAVLAHLRRGSLRVRKGQSVRAGEVLAECGNSGNSTEPHLHFQLMDHRNPLFAAGVPVSFDSYTVDGKSRSGMPSKHHAFEVEQHPTRDREAPAWTSRSL